VLFPRVSMLIVWASLASPSVARASDYVWIEGESSTSHTMRRHGWYDSVAKESLSGG
jgi:hypothetical protein